MTAMHGQPSAPSYQNYHARWEQSVLPPSENHVPPLFDYELYRESRGREPSFQIEPTSDHQGLSSMVNSYYESPHDKMGMHNKQSALHYGGPSVRAAAGPLMALTSGGYEPYAFQKSGNWNTATTNAAQRYTEQGDQQQQQRQQHTPFLSLAIVVAHFVTLIMVMHQNACSDSCLFPSLHKFAFQPFGENPLLGPSAKTLLAMGALESDLITKAREGWRLLSAMWLHAGFLHMIGNDVAVLLLGIPLERHMGFIKVGVTYLLSGFIGNIVSALMVQGRVSVGGSGALMGLLGATLSSVIVNWKTYPNRWRALAGVLFYIALNTVFGLMPLVDNFMHVGGALTGFLVGNLFLVHHSFRCWKSSVVYDQEDMPEKRKHAIILDIVWLLSLGTVIVFGIMALYALFSGMNISKGCTWCPYLTCAPSRFWKCSGNRQLGCNPSSVGGGLRVTCATGQAFHYATVPYANRITPEIEGLCVKACV